MVADTGHVVSVDLLEPELEGAHSGTGCLPPSFIEM